MLIFSLSQPKRSAKAPSVTLEERVEQRNLQTRKFKAPKKDTDIEHEEKESEIIEVKKPKAKIVQKDIDVKDDNEEPEEVNKPKAKKPNGRQARTTRTTATAAADAAILKSKPRPADRLGRKIILNKGPIAEPYLGATVVNLPGIILGDEEPNPESTYVGWLRDEENWVHVSAERHGQEGVQHTCVLYRSKMNDALYNFEEIEFLRKYQGNSKKEIENKIKNSLKPKLMRSKPKRAAGMFKSNRSLLNFAIRNVITDAQQNKEAGVVDKATVTEERVEAGDRVAVEEAAPRRLEDLPIEGGNFNGVEEPVIDDGKGYGAHHRNSERPGVGQSITPRSYRSRNQDP